MRLLELDFVHHRGTVVHTWHRGLVFDQYRLSLAPDGRIMVSGSSSWARVYGGGMLRFSHHHGVRLMHLFGGVGELAQAPAITRFNVALALRNVNGGFSARDIPISEFIESDESDDAGTPCEQVFH